MVRDEGRDGERDDESDGEGDEKQDLLRQPLPPRRRSDRHLCRLTGKPGSWRRCGPGGGIDGSRCESLGLRSAFSVWDFEACFCAQSPWQRWKQVKSLWSKSSNPSSPWRASATTRSANMRTSKFLVRVDSVTPQRHAVPNATAMAAEGRQWAVTGKGWQEAAVE